MTYKLLSTARIVRLEAGWTIPPRRLGQQLTALTGDDDISTEGLSIPSAVERMTRLANKFSDDPDFMASFDAGIENLIAADRIKSYCRDATYAKKLAFFLRVAETAVKKEDPQVRATVKKALGLYPSSANFACRGGAIGELESAILEIDYNYFQRTITSVLNNYIAKRNIANFVRTESYHTHIPKGLRILLGAHKKTILDADEGHSLGMIQDIPHTSLLILWRQLNATFLGDLEGWMPTAGKSMSQDQYEQTVKKGIVDRQAMSALFTGGAPKPTTLAQLAHQSRKFETLTEEIAHKVAPDQITEVTRKVFEVAKTLMTEREGTEHQALILVDGHYELNEAYGWDIPDETVSIEGETFTIRLVEINAFLFSLSEPRFEPVADFNTQIQKTVQATPLRYEPAAGLHPRRIRLGKQNDLYGPDAAQHISAMVDVLKAVRDKQPVHPQDVAETLVILRSEIEGMNGSNPMVAFLVIEGLGTPIHELDPGITHPFEIEHLSEITVKYFNFMETFKHLPLSPKLLLSDSGFPAAENTPENRTALLAFLVDNGAPLSLLKSFQLKAGLCTDSDLADELSKALGLRRENRRKLVSLTPATVAFLYEHHPISRQSIHRLLGNEKSASQIHHRDPEAYDNLLVALWKVESQHSEAATGGEAAPRNYKPILQGVRQGCHKLLETALDPRKSDCALDFKQAMELLQEGPYKHHFLLVMQVLYNYTPPQERVAVVAEHLAQLPITDKMMSLEAVKIREVYKRVLKEETVSKEVRKVLAERCLECLTTCKDNSHTPLFFTADLVTSMSDTLPQLIVEKKEDIIKDMPLAVFQLLLREDIVVLIGKEQIKALLLEIISEPRYSTPTRIPGHPPTSVYEAPLARVVPLYFSTAFQNLFSSPEAYRKWILEEANIPTHPIWGSVESNRPRGTALLQAMNRKDFLRLIYSPQFVKGFGPKLFIDLLSVQDGLLLSLWMKTRVSYKTEQFTLAYFDALGEHLDDLFKIEMPLTGGRATILSYPCDITDLTKPLHNPALWPKLVELGLGPAFFTTQRIANILCRPQASVGLMTHVSERFQSLPELISNEDKIEALRLCIIYCQNPLYAKPYVIEYLKLARQLSLGYKDVVEFLSEANPSTRAVKKGLTIHYESMEVYSMLEQHLFHEIQQITVGVQNLNDQVSDRKAQRPQNPAEKREKAKDLAQLKLDLKSKKAALKQAEKELVDLHKRFKYELETYGDYFSEGSVGQHDELYDIFEATNIQRCYYFVSKRDATDHLDRLWRMRINSSRTLTPEFKAQNDQFCLRIQFKDKGVILFGFDKSDYDAVKENLAHFQRSFPVQSIKVLGT